MELAYYILLGLGVCALFFFSYSLICYVQKKNLIALGFRKLCKYTTAHEAIRTNDFVEAYQRQGATETKGLLNKLDRKILQSGVKNKYKKMNAELLLLLTSVVGLSIALIISGIFRSVILFILSLVVVFALVYLWLDIKCIIAYHNEEKNLIVFMDLVHSYSASSDDIIQILDYTSHHMTEPLRSKIAECCTQARITGDTSGALQDLSLKIGHEKFYEVIANLEIGSKYRANYTELIDSLRDDMRAYLRGREEDKARASSARIMWLVLFGLGFAMLKMMNGFGEASIFTILATTLIGNIIIGYFIVLAVILAIQIVKSLK